jgi:hypothetical protein
MTYSSRSQGCAIFYFFPRGIWDWDGWGMGGGWGPNQKVHIYLFVSLSSIAAMSSNDDYAEEPIAAAEDGGSLLCELNLDFDAVAILRRGLMFIWGEGGLQLRCL